MIAWTVRLIFDYSEKGITDIAEIKQFLNQNIGSCRAEKMEHALHYIYENGYAREENGKLTLTVEIDDDFKEYLLNLLSYGLTRYFIGFGDETDSKLWQSYRMNQVQMKFLMCLLT